MNAAYKAQQKQRGRVLGTIDGHREEEIAPLDLNEDLRNCLVTCVLTCAAEWLCARENLDLQIYIES